MPNTQPSKLREDILFTLTGDSYGEELHVDNKAKFLADDLVPVLKSLMLETYNQALQAHFIDKTTTSLDEAFDQAVNAL